MTDRLKGLILPAALLFAAALLFCRAVGFEFVRLDDHDYTFRCAFVMDGFSWANLRAAFSQFRHAAIWMPATYLTYMADISLFGKGMAGHHGTNVLIHAVNAALFLMLLMRMRPKGTSPYLCLMAAAVWALHPLRVEPVAWIAGRKELLCGAFTLLGLHAWVRGRRGLGSVACLLACLSKPTAMCFPFLAYAVENLASGSTEDRLAINPPKKPLWYLPLFLMAVATGLIAVYSQTNPDGYDVRALYTVPFFTRLANSVVSIGIYAFEFFVPVGLHIDVRLPQDGVPLLWWAEAAGGYALLGGFAWLFRRSPNVLAWCAFFFLASVGPVLGLFGSFGREAHADRFTYLPLMAMSLAMVLGSASLPRRVPAVALKSAACAWPAALALWAFLLLPAWRNDYTVFSRVLECVPDHARALSHVASEECARNGRFGVAIAHYRASLAKEWHEGTAGELAFALATHGFKAEGMANRAEYAKEIRKCCRTALANPRGDRKGLMLEALGVAAYWERKWKEAAVFFRLAASVPDHTRLNARDDALARLAVSLANMGSLREANQLLAALARPGAAREDVRRFAENALEQLSSGARVMLFF